MSFDDILEAVQAQLLQEERIAYRVLKRRYDLNDEDIEDIKADLIDAKQLAYDEDGKVLVRAGGATVAAAVTATAAPEQADRRLITVMFCDIVGSTELSTRYDAEDLREVIREYQQICAAVVSRCDGHVAQYLGDGLLVYFGYPAALDDEAGRAVQAGLEILTALQNASELTARLGEPLRVRIGIHTGPVVIGEMGGANRHERLALGETPNIAARVQGAARPNEILITAATHRLVDGLYQCELHGPHALKGVAEPVRLYTVRGEGAPVNRFEVALSTGSLNTFFGREQELALLGQHWTQASQGQGQVVLLSGEPGIGKSRLVQEFKKTVGESARHITLRCSPNHENSAYFPLVHLLQRVFAFEDDDSDLMLCSKLETTLSGYAFAEDQTAPLLAKLLGVPHPREAEVEALDPAAHKAALFDALIEWLLEESNVRPLYMIWDDVHWMDPASHELLNHYLAHVPATRAMVVLVYRSQFVPPWNPRAFLSHLSMRRLSDEDVGMLITEAAEGSELPVTLREFIRDKTDGVPLYIEELTKSIVEAGVVERLDAGEALEKLLTVAVPATLQDSLEARLDRCPNGKHVAQWGAVIGREFAYELLEHLIPDRNLLSRGLSELLEAELVYRSGTRASPTYIFKHALVRDTAYESLLIRNRRACHAAIGRVLSEHFADVVQREPELVAGHFYEGGAHARALGLLHNAAEREIRRSAGTVAEGHLGQALRIIETLPDDAARAQAEIRARLLLGPLVSARHGNAAPEVEENYQRVVKLCEQYKDTSSIFPAYFGLRAHYLTKSDLRAAHRIGEALYRAAQSSGSPAHLLEANVALVSSCFFRGDLADVARHAAEGLEHYARDQHANHAYIYGAEPGSLCLIRGAQVAWMQGYPDRAVALTHEALALVGTIDHVVSQAFVHDNASALFGWLQRYDESVAQATASIRLAEKYGIGFGQGWGLVQLGHTRVRAGDHAGGLADIEQGMNLLESAGPESTFRTQLIYPWFVILLADAYGRTGDPERGLSLLPEVVALSQKSGARYADPVLYRVRGELLHTLGLAIEARKSLLRSLEICRERNTPGFQLQSAISLVAASATDADRAAAQAVLGETMALFKEGFTTADWLAATALAEPRQATDSTG